jgi:FkbM family methyltransferase
VAGVEANPALCELLRSKYADNSRISIHQFAAAESESDAELTINADDGMSSLLPWKADSEHSKRTVDVVPVRCRPLDMIATDAELGEITVLKLDVQGAELLTLRGACRLLGEARVKLIHCEVWFSDRDYDGQPNFCDISRYLAPHGFSVYGLYNTTQHPFTPNRPLNACDVLFIHQSLLNSLKPLARVKVGGRLTPLNRPVWDLKGPDR